MSVDIGSLRLVVDAETKGMERAMVRVQKSLQGTEAAMEAMGKGQAGNTQRAAALERAMISLGRKGLDANHESMQRLAAAHNKIQNEMEQTAKATKLAEKNQQSYNAAVRTAQNITKVGMAVAAAAVAATGKAIAVYSDYEQTELAFNTLLGSAEKSAKFLKDAWDFRLETPFDYSAILDASKQMMAYGFESENVLDILESIGDAAAGLGGGAQTINRIALALGQMRGKGKVSGEEMRQLTEAGIGAWDILAESIGTTVPAAMKLAEQGAIPISRALDGLIEGIGESFDGLMVAQSQSLQGLISSTKDLAFGQRGLFGYFGEYAADTLKLHERLAGLNTGLKNTLATVESKGFKEAWDDWELSPAVEGSFVTLAAAFGAIVKVGLQALPASIKAIGLAMGLAAGKAALWAAFLYANYKFLDMMQDKISKVQAAQNRLAAPNAGISFGGDPAADDVHRLAAQRDQRNVMEAQKNMSDIAEYNRAQIDIVTGVYDPKTAEQEKAQEELAQERLKSAEAAYNEARARQGLSVQGTGFDVDLWRDWSSQQITGQGFATGGHTGNVGRNQVAGVVHGQEWVMPAWMTKRYPELVGMLENMRTRGYAAGGFVGVGDLMGANRALQQLSGTMRSAANESKRGGDLFMLDRAVDATRIYRNAGSAISESLMQARSSGSDSMYNLSRSIANSARYARDSAVRDIGNINQALKLDTKGAIEALEDIEKQAAQAISSIKWDGPSLNTRLAGMAVPEFDIDKLNAQLDEMNAKYRQAAEARKAAGWTNKGIELTDQQAWDTVLVGLMAVTFPAFAASLDDLGDHSMTVLGKMGQDFIVQTNIAELALLQLGRNLRESGNQAEEWHWSVRSASKGALESFAILSDQGAASMGILKREFLVFMQELDAGKATWQDFGNTLLSVAEQTIIAAEAQLLAGKLAAITSALMTAPLTGGASLLAIPGILVEAAAGMAALETARWILPDAKKQDTPKAAKGAIVLPRPGGTKVITAEAGQAEAIIPLNRIEEYIGRTGGGAPVQIHLHMHGAVIREEQDINRITDQVMDAAVRMLKREGVVPSLG